MIRNLERRCFEDFFEQIMLQSGDEANEHKLYSLLFMI